MKTFPKSLRAWAPLVASALLSPGCASESRQSKECVLDAERRPFGQRFEYFFGMVAEVDDVIAEDWNRGTRNLAGDADRWWEGQARDAGATADLIMGALPAAADSFRLRGAYLAGDFERWASRVAKDTRCLVPRAWHSLKLLE